jgi:hypothetical protein
MRTYEPAWHKLKSDLELRIAAEPSVHARIVKAVIKEKNMDVIYKIQLDEECKRAILTWNKQHKMLIFKLRFVMSRFSRSDF